MGKQSSASEKGIMFKSWVGSNGPQSVSDRFFPVVFSVPIFIFYVLLVLLPVLNSVWLSLFEWDGIGQKVFVGLGNFARVFSDPIALTALRNNIIWVILSVTIPIIMALVLVAILAGNIPEKVRLFFRTIYYVPAVIAIVVTAIIWQWIYSPIFGVNKILRDVGLDFLAHSWLGDEKTALYAVFLANAWMYFGYCLVILLAAVQRVSPVFYEAAQIDGANAWKQFWHITIPGIRNELNFVVLITAINAFKVFPLVYVMTGGGPYYSTETVATYVYRKAFIEHEVGYSSSIAVILTLIVVVLAKVSLYLRERNA